MYRLQFVYQCRINDVLTRVKAIICNSICNTVFIFYPIWHVKTYKTLHIYISGWATCESDVGLTSVLHFRSSRPYLSATITSSPLKKPLLEHRRFTMRQHITRNLISVNLYSTRQTPYNVISPWNPSFPSWELTPFLLDAESHLR